MDKTVSLTNISEEKTVFDLPLENIAQCVMPQNNKNEVELQFQESDTRGIEDDNLVQLTFHFPHATVNNDDSDKEDDDEPADTIAEAFHKNILDAGIIQNLTGNVIVEFTKEQGTFVQPRGRYTIQVRQYEVCIFDYYFLIAFMFITVDVKYFSPHGWSTV